MSRELGKLQRQILAIIRARDELEIYPWETPEGLPCDDMRDITSQLAEWVGGARDLSHQASVCQAIERLEATGWIRFHSQYRTRGNRQTLWRDSQRRIVELQGDFPQPDKNFRRMVESAKALIVADKQEAAAAAVVRRPIKPPISTTAFLFLRRLMTRQEVGGD
jgi:hypothetical protein